jgi:hypothetical protein|tara:strand:+ start:2795 stop:3124 length:330 start_codon:yes stop_codon:yes gene_type:complete
MATFFRSKVLKDVGVVKTPGIICDASTRATIIGISLTNLTQSNIFVNMLVADDTSVEGFYLKDVLIPPNASLKPLGPAEKIILAPSNSISFQSNETDSLDVVLSYVDIV